MLARRWHTAIVFYRCYHFFQRESHHSHHEGLVRFQCALELLEHQTITRKMGGMDHLPMPQTNSSVTSRRTNASDHRDILVGLWCELLLIKRESEWKQIRTRGEPTPVTLTIIFIPIWESGFLTEHSWENGFAKNWDWVEDCSSSIEPVSNFSLAFLEVCRNRRAFLTEAHNLTCNLFFFFLLCSSSLFG